MNSIIGHHHFTSCEHNAANERFQNSLVCVWPQWGKKKAELLKKGQWLNLRAGAVVSARETALLKQVPVTGEVPFMIIFLLI